jgi:hypothetical protein
MDDKEIKQLRKAVFHQMNIAKMRLENASFILQREVKVDAASFLFKAVDTTVRILLDFKHKPSSERVSFSAWGGPVSNFVSIYPSSHREEV